MGMFDSYFPVKEFNCPKCGLKHEGEFQTKALLNEEIKKGVNPLRILAVLQANIPAKLLVCRPPSPWYGKRTGLFLSLTSSTARLRRLR